MRGQRAPDDDAVRRVLALELVAGHSWSSARRAALAVGQQQLDVREAALELLLDALAQLLDALARERAQTRIAPGWRKPTSSRRSVVQRVGLVEHEQARLLAGADLVEDVVDRA